MPSHRIASFAYIVMLAAVVVAQDAADPPATLPAALARIDQLQRDNEALRVQVRTLEGVVMQLRGKPLPPDVAPPVPGDVPGGDDADLAPAQRPYASALDLLRKLPPALQLTASPGPRHEWTGKQSRLVRRWLAGAFVTQPYDGREVIESVQVARNSQRNSDPNALPFVVTVKFKPREVNYQGHIFLHRMSTATLYGDESFAKRAESVKPGISVRVTGKIHDISNEHTIFEPHSFKQINIELAERKIHLPALTP